MFSFIIELIIAAIGDFLLMIPGAFLRASFLWAYSGFKRDFKTTFLDGDISFDRLITICAIVIFIVVSKIL
ncbi:hypothetical protein ACTHGU_21325 [Chitinophagaceae bacterium MMS25-I14]